MQSYTHADTHIHALIHTYTHTNIHALSRTHAKTIPCFSRQLNGMQKESRTSSFEFKAEKASN